MKYKNKGFTMLEILIVVAIVGIISSLSVPSFIRRSRKNYMITIGTEMVSNIRWSHQLSVAANPDDYLAGTRYRLKILDDGYDIFSDKPSKNITFDNALIKNTSEIKNNNEISFSLIGEPTFRANNAAAWGYMVEAHNSILLYHKQDTNIIMLIEISVQSGTVSYKWL